MQDPSSGIAPQILHHVHLKSSYQYPLIPQMLPVEQVLDHLLRAPQIVRDAPVSWTYMTAPPDGTLMMTWRPPSLLGRQFGTDGIIWAGAETVYKHDIQGYTIEFAVYTSGFAPPQDQFTVHRRTRYRLIANVNNAPIDPNLELVHWTESQPEHRIPSRNVQVQVFQQSQMRERRYLEMQGPLPRKEFMLNDRNNWPTISLPGNQIPQNPYQNSAQGRNSVPAFNRTPSGNRAMPGQLGAPGPGMVAPFGKPGQPGMPIITPFANLAEDILENERNTEFGDMLDFLTPREISTARYKQHHEWIEEILSSPYTIKQILPVDLGLRLTGSLKGLTDDLWADAASIEVDGMIAPEAGTAKKVDLERLKQFEEKVARHRKDAEAELEEMRRVHAATLDDIKRQKAFAVLERQLAESPNGNVDAITRAAEQAIGGRLGSRQEIVVVQKGGLLNKGEENVAIQQQPEEFNADFSNLDTAGEALDFYSNDYPT